MGKLATCRDCGARVSRKARACPSCGRRFGRSLVGALVGLVVKGGLVAVLILVGLAWVASKPPGTAGPGAVGAAPPSDRTRTGDVGTLELPGGKTVWLATTDADWNPMIDAENAASLPRMYELAQQGRAQVYPNGTKVRVLKSSPFGRFVEVVEGEDRGRSGWVQVEFVKKVAPGR